MTVVCVYWDTSTSSCGASSYYNTSDISCYNGGSCDGSGTCLECNKYDVPGMKFWTLDGALTQTQVPLNLRICNLRAYFRKCCFWSGAPIDLYAGSYSSSFTSTSGPLSVVSLSPTANSTVSSDFILSFSLEDSSGPLDLSSYTLSVDGTSQTINPNGTFSTSISTSSKAEGYRFTISLSFPNYKGSGVTRSFSWTYNYKISNRVQPFLDSSNTRCTLSEAAAYQKAGTADNPYPFPCNGANPNCIYYTGPTWEYCTNDKLLKGKSVTASQIMELRYYSRDWWKMSNPKAEWNNSFKYPDIWSWAGSFEHGGSKALGENDTPMVRKISVDTFESEVLVLSIGQKVPADRGVQVYGGIPEYPTLVFDLNSTTTGLRVLWPETAVDDPFIFRTFRIGQEYVWVIAYVPDEGELYAVNMNKHLQGNIDNNTFITYMQEEYPEDLFSASVSSSNIGVVFIPMTLEHTNAYGSGCMNTLRIYFKASGSSVINTDDVFVKHKFYHGMIAQTSGKDLSGIKSFEPVVTTFSSVNINANIWDLTNNTSVRQVLWDALPGGKMSIYDTEEIVEDYTIETWTPIDCKMAIIEIDDTRCSHVIPWKISGSVRGTTLKVSIDRSSNSKVPTSSEKTFDLELYYKSEDGRFLPGNMAIVVIPSSKRGQPPLDPEYDVITATYAVTEYKQGPVVSSDIVKLKRPTLRDRYITNLFIRMSNTSSSISITGPALKIISGSSEDYIDSGTLFSFRDKIIKANLENESNSMDSFHDGGINDSEVETYSEIFDRLKLEFESEYSGYTFDSDGLSVTLERVCDRLEDLKQDDGSYKVLVVFNDENGRPIGIKRSYMLLQSAVAQTRDVEIYYKWQMQRQFWLIVDQYFCLAEMAEPMVPGNPNGVEVLTPKCGDHSPQTGSQTIYSSWTLGSSGPMWYPYHRCLMPRYEQKSPDASIRCENNVEGFAGDYEGKRHAYWERMRGPDVFRTVDLGPIVDLCCCYGSRDGNWQSIGEQKFIGYTKIRSTHPNGMYGKDRESIRLSRHFNKRNLKVRREVTAQSDDENMSNISSQYESILYGDSGSITIGASGETPVWVHINDNVSEVSRTTEEAQHPFSHYVLNSVGPHSYAETFVEGTRQEMSDVIEERDLTQVSSSISKPVGPTFSLIEGIEEVGDNIWVYKALGTAWAWLERPKEPVRGSPIIGGVKFSNPIRTMWQTSLKTATHSEEGSHTLSYKAPVFEEDGTLQSNPYITLDGGPQVTIDWVTGTQTRGDEYSSTVQNLVGGTDEPFQLFGLGDNASSFIADSTGVHKYVRGYNDSTVLYGRTFSGLSMSTSINLPSLPYELRELFTSYSELYTPIEPKVIGPSLQSFEVVTKGYFYVERIEVSYSYDNDYDIPTLGLFRYDSSGVSSNISSNGYIAGTPSKELSTRLETYTVNSWCSKIRFQYGGLRQDRKAAVSSIKIWYRHPVDRGESIYIYDRKVNISTGVYGNKDYRELLYYYSKVFWDTGSAANSDGGLTRVGRNIKDIILEYEFYDPSGSRFGSYREDVSPSTITGYMTDNDGVSYLEGPLTIYTKGRSLLAGTHKTDVMDQYLSTDEDVSFSHLIGKEKLYEEAQERLYEESKALVDNNTTTLYTWFWHPDELEFFQDDLGVPEFSTRFTCTLNLYSTVIPMHYIWMHDRFCCTQGQSSPYGDGRIHYINTWRALGHWIYAGTPRYNHPCGVVLSKIGQHIGEKYYGTSTYKGLSFNPEFPWETPRDASYYLNRGLVVYGGGVYTGTERSDWAAYQSFGSGV